MKALAIFLLIIFTILNLLIINPLEFYFNYQKERYFEAQSNQLSCKYFFYLYNDKQGIGDQSCSRDVGFLDRNAHYNHYESDRYL